MEPRNPLHNSERGCVREPGGGGGGGGGGGVDDQKIRRA